MVYEPNLLLVGVVCLKKPYIHPESFLRHIQPGHENVYASFVFAPRSRAMHPRKLVTQSDELKFWHKMRRQDLVGSTKKMNARVDHFVEGQDTFYDRGSIFPLFVF